MVPMGAQDAFLPLEHRPLPPDPARPARCGPGGVDNGLGVTGLMVGQVRFRSLRGAIRPA